MVYIDRVYYNDFLQYDWYDHTLAPEFMKFIILVDPSCVIGTMPGVDKIFLKKYIKFTFFTPNLTIPPFLEEVGHEIYDFSSPNPKDATFQILWRLVS